MRSEQTTPRGVILGFSFGLRKNSPGTCNIDLIRLFLQRKDMRKIPLILQEELKDAAYFLLGKDLKKADVPSIHIVHIFESSPKCPPTTKEMAQQGVELAREGKYNVIYILAFPVIHRFFCWYFTKKYANPHGIRVEIIKTGYIPFDQDSDQWLARGPIRLICYTILNACGARWL